MGATARDQARPGKLTGRLARRYAEVWPAREDDLPGYIPAGYTTLLAEHHHE